jgi:class 3 adenylate cyclase
MLYADLASSTKLVDSKNKEFSAEQYKTYLACASRIIRSEGGYIRSFDGDRVMGVFIGDSKNTSAVRSGLKIKWAVTNIIQPAMRKIYPFDDYVMKHVVGIDTSEVLVVRGGIRNNNDLLWIGRCANYAAKLCAMDDVYSTYITDSIYNNIADEAKKTNGVDMWTADYWSDMNFMPIYKSNWLWAFT